MATLTFNNTKKNWKKKISIKSQPTFFEGNCLQKKPDSRKLASKSQPDNPGWERELQLPNRQLQP